MNRTNLCGVVGMVAGAGMGIWASIAGADIVSFPRYGPSTTIYPSVRGLSDDGSTLIGISPTASPTQVVGLRWTTAAPYVLLNSGPVAATDNTFAGGVSADGGVVSGSDLTLHRAFRWTSGGGAVLIDTRAAGAGGSSAASGVSGDGSVIVGSFDSQPARWTQGTGFVQLGLLPGTSNGSANRVSANGATVVGSNYTLAGSPLLMTSAQAFRWTSGGGGGMVELTRAAGRAVAEATDVSADGHVTVGNNSLGFTPPDMTVGAQWHDHPVAARWVDSGAPTLLPIPAGADWALATATNGDGSIVVGNAGTGGSDVFGNVSTVPWIWTAGGGTVGLAPYLQSLGINLSAWANLGSIADISADGRTIAGIGDMFISPTQTAGVPWLVTIPSPGAAGLGGIGLMLSARRRR